MTVKNIRKYRLTLTPVIIILNLVSLFLHGMYKYYVVHLTRWKIVSQYKIYVTG